MDAIEAKTWDPQIKLNKITLIFTVPVTMPNSQVQFLVDSGADVRIVPFHSLSQIIKQSTDD